MISGESKGPVPTAGPGTSIGAVKRSARTARPCPGGLGTENVAAVAFEEASPSVVGPIATVSASTRPSERLAETSAKPATSRRARGRSIITDLPSTDKGREGANCADPVQPYPPSALPISARSPARFHVVIQATGQSSARASGGPVHRRYTAPAAAGTQATTHVAEGGRVRTSRGKSKAGARTEGPSTDRWGEIPQGHAR
jgi:hypothetical protein